MLSLGPPVWVNQSLLYNPLFAKSWECVPCSTTRPWEITKMTSEWITVLNLWAIVIEVLPSCAASKASWTTYDETRFKEMLKSINVVRKSITTWLKDFFLIIPFLILNPELRLPHPIAKWMDFVSGLVLWLLVVFGLQIIVFPFPQHEFDIPKRYCFHIFVI